MALWLRYSARLPARQIISPHIFCGPHPAGFWGRGDVFRDLSDIPPLSPTLGETAESLVPHGIRMNLPVWERLNQRG